MIKYSNRSNKYGNHRTKDYHSDMEEVRWHELKLLERVGEITDLRKQVPFTLVPSQRNENGKVIERPIKYVADYVYTDKNTGKTVVEDVKGYRTQEYIIKRKLMLYLHGIRIKEV